MNLSRHTTGRHSFFEVVRARHNLSFSLILIRKGWIDFSSVMRGWDHGPIPFSNDPRGMISGGIGV